MQITMRTGFTIAMLSTVFCAGVARAEQPAQPCHPNPGAAADRLAVAARGDVANLPTPLKDRLVQLADRPHTYLPMQVFAEAEKPSQLFQYYLLDTDGFQPNVFTTIMPGVNDHVQLTVTGGNCVYRLSVLSASSLNPSPGFRPIHRIRAHSSMSLPTSRRCL
jgi:hypothetical protein